jgi:polar amino acid transport system substrate-binding protein
LKLTQGRIDLTLDDSRVLEYEINQFMPNRRNDLVFLSKPLAVQGVRIGVSRQNPDHEKIVAAFNKAMEEMKKDGTYQKIIDKHKAYIETPVQ